MVNGTLNNTVNETLKNVAIASVRSNKMIPWIPIPDWVIIIVTLLVAIVIYLILPEDLKTPTKSFLKKYAFYIVLCLLWLYFRNKWGFVWENPTKFPANLKLATFWALFILLLYKSANWLLNTERYYTTAFVCNGVQGSCNRYQEIGNWVVFFLGTCGSSTEKMVLPWWLPNKLVVTPKSACDFLGDKIVCKTQVFKADLEDVPPEVRHFIETDTFARMRKDEVYYGEVSEKLRMEDPKYSDIEDKYKKVNNRNAELDTMLKGKLSYTKRFISDTFAMQDKIKGKDWVRKNRDTIPQEE